MRRLRKNIMLSRIIFGLLSVLAVMISIYNMIHYGQRPVDECTWGDTENGVVVEFVAPEGTAYSAGLRAGDLLLTIDGISATNSARAQAVLDRQSTESVVPYLILRDGELIPLQVTMVNAGFPALFISMIIVGFLFWLVGFWIVWMRPQDPKARVLFFLFLCFMLLWTLNLVPPLTGIMRLVISALNTIVFAMIPALFLLFFMFYPVPHPFLEKKWFRIVLFAPTLFILIWFFAASAFGAPSPVSFTGGIGIWGGYFTLGMIRLYRHYKHSTNAFIRRQIRILYWAMFLGLIPPFLIILGNLTNLSVPFVEYIIPLMAVIPLAFAYTVIRHRLMDIEIFVKRSFAYTVLSVLIVGFYMVVVQVIVRFIQDTTGAAGTLILFLSTFLVAIVFTPLRERILRTVDQAFYREAYDYRETLRQFARTLNTLLNPEVLVRTVLTRTCETMHIRTGYFFQMDDACCCTCTCGYPVLPPETVSIPVDSFFCEHMQQRKTKGPFFISEVTEKAQIHEGLKALKGVVVLPLQHQDRLLGFMIMGEKQSDLPYSAEDVELLATLSDQMAVAFENGRLHLALTEQERLKKELEIARRIQMLSLPQDDPKIDGYDIYGVSVPATEVGGDYYDYLNIDEHHLGLVIGDVSGKGTSAALYVSKIQGFFRALLPGFTNLPTLISRVNTLFVENTEDQAFITLLAAVLHPDSRKIELIRAGHLPVLHYQRKSGQCEAWCPKGVGLGMTEASVFDQSVVPEVRILELGDVLLFYTDGLTEAEDDHGDEYGEDRLEALFCRWIDQSAEGIGSSIISEIQQFTQNQAAKDDMTLIVVKVNELNLNSI